MNPTQKQFSLRCTLALVFVASAVSVSATLIEVTAANGTYKVIYETTQQSPAITNVVSPGREIIASMHATFVGEQDLTGAGDGILSTTFVAHQNLQFVPTPGFAFTSFTMGTSVAGYTHGFFGGHQFFMTGLITASDNSTTVLGMPVIQIFPNWGQMGGGAHNLGLFAGVVMPVPPPGGFNLDMTETIVLYDNSSLGWSSMTFDLQTVAVPVLGIQSVSSQIRLFWSTNHIGFHLQSAASVGPSAAWGDVTNTPAASAGFYQVTVVPSESNLYFRLAKP